MNDRELLELAAKAAAYNVREYDEDDYGDAYGLLNGERWNPLADDGDALRLAVKLRINVCHAVGGVYAEDQNSEIGVRESRADDANSATRRAIVRAAAQIGQSM